VLLATLALVLNACGAGNAVRVLTNGEAPGVNGTGPHYAASLTLESQPVAQSGFLELFLDEDSMTAQVRAFNDAEWFTLPQTSQTPLANAGANAVALDIIVHGTRITLNAQDHAVAWGHTTSEAITHGVQVNYLFMPNEQTASNFPDFDESDVAFMVYVRYTLQDGNFYVEADWRNVSGNPNAFIESIGLMERFGALRNPGNNDFLLLPDGGGALLFPARTGGNFSETAQLHFQVYGEDPTNPVTAENSATHMFRDEQGDVLSANVAAFGARSGSTAFVAVVERGASLATIVAQQNIPGEPNINQSAVGARFSITPTTLGPEEQSESPIYRAAQSVGGRDEYSEGEDFPIRICYRFFYGAGTTNFSTMATSIREQLIGTRLLSPARTVTNPDWPLPLNLTLLGTADDENGRQQTLTTFDQGLDILTRLKLRGVDNINVRFMGGLNASNPNPERVRPLRRLGGRSDLTSLQEYCLVTSFSLFLDTNILHGTGAVDLSGQALPLRTNNDIPRAVRSVINRLGGLQTAGISLGDVGHTLYADYHLNREQAKEALGNSLPAFSIPWQVMMDTGFFHAVRTADVVVNLPVTPALPTCPPGEMPRYQCVPLLAMILHGSMDFSGPSLNLQDDPELAFLRGMAYGASPAFTWSATPSGDEDDPLHFEPQIDTLVQFYTRANDAMADLRGERIVQFDFDAQSQVSTTRYSNNAIVYVNFSNQEVVVNDITLPARDFVRIG